MLLVDEVAQGHDRGESALRTVFRPEIGLDEPPYGLAPVERSSHSAEAVAQAQLSIIGRELGRAAEFLLGRTGRGRR